MLSAGMFLRQIRDSLGLTMRDVEDASAIIAQQRDSQEYLIPPSRLSDIETKGIVPSVFRFYCLAAIYHRPARELLRLYGIDLDETKADWDASRPAKSHLVTLDSEQNVFEMPVKLDPGFDLRETSDLGRMVQQWGTVPLSLLAGWLLKGTSTVSSAAKTSRCTRFYSPEHLFKWMSRRGRWWTNSGDRSTSAQSILWRHGTDSLAVGAHSDSTR